MACRVKICGITRYEDAAAALDAGADALGFVLAPSGREVTPGAVRRIVGRLPPFASCVGVFVDAPAALMHELRAYCGLDRLQLQGQEPPEVCDVLGPGVIKGFKVGGAVDAAQVRRYAASPHVSAYLFDAHVPGRSGGTGTSFSWNLLQGHAFARPVIVAGGLHPGNVRAAVLATRPHAVDVCSGVEQSIGKKDRRRLRDFIDQAKGVDLDAPSQAPPAVPITHAPSFQTRQPT